MCPLLCGRKFSTLGKHQGGQFLECMVRVCLVLYEAATLSSKAAVRFAFPWAISRNSCSSMYSPAVGAVSFPNLGHSDRRLVISHFNLHFPDVMWCAAFFHTTIYHPYFFFGKLLKSLALFFNPITWFFFVCGVLRVLCVFWLTFFIMGLLQIFSSSLLLAFSFSSHCLSQRDIFNCNEVQFINDFLLWIVPLVLYLETCHLPKVI